MINHYENQPLEEITLDGIKELMEEYNATLWGSLEFKIGKIYHLVGTRYLVTAN